MDMIERVAKALSPDWFEPNADVLNNYPGQHLEYQKRAREQARAAIEAMREPDEAMMAAGSFELSEVEREAVTNAWQAMIDAALSTPPEPVGREK